MDYFLYILGVIIASQVAFFVLYSWGKKNKLVKQEVFKSSGNGTTLQQEIGRDADVIVVGAGVAGAALAQALGKDGSKVQVIERDLTKQDRIVGELLQLFMSLKIVLKRLILRKCLAMPSTWKGREPNYLTPLESFSSQVSGRGFHNGRFVQRLRHKAASLAK